MTTTKGKKDAEGPACRDHLTFCKNGIYRINSLPVLRAPSCLGHHNDRPARVVQHVLRDASQKDLGHPGARVGGEGEETRIERVRLFHKHMSDTLRVGLALDDVDYRRGTLIRSRELAHEFGQDEGFGEGEGFLVRRAVACRDKVDRGYTVAAAKDEAGDDVDEVEVVPWAEQVLHDKGECRD